MKDIKNVIPVILAGGSGTRLWPLSSHNYPKQFHRILGKHNLLEQTLGRLIKGCPKEIFVIGSQTNEELLKESLFNVDVDLTVFLEPSQKNTAPAITIAALKAQPEDFLLVTPSDHFLPHSEFLFENFSSFDEFTEDGSIILFGIKPTFPSNSYGYIEKGKENGDLYEVASFKEKPNTKKAEKYLNDGKYLWNSGIFLFRASDFLKKMEEFSPSILRLCKEALNGANTLQDFIYLKKEPYENLEKISIDYALLEKTPQLKVIETDATWGDLGTWKSIQDHSLKDDDDNTLIGNVYIDNVKKSYINSDNENLIVSGLRDLLVIGRNNHLIISSRDSIENIDPIIRAIDSNQNEGYSVRPWGKFKTLFKNDYCHVKLLIVNEDGQLSLQKHKYRSEHWTITSGKAKVVKGKAEIELSKDDSIKIEKGQIHRIMNIGIEELQIIEVQIGEYFGEDDIERFEDIYNRD